MNNRDNKNTVYVEKVPTFCFLFDSLQSEYLNGTQKYKSTITLQNKSKEFQYQTFNFVTQIMISDLILFWETGYLKDKLNVSGYINLISLFDNFNRNSNRYNKQYILCFQYINKENEKLSIISQHQVVCNYCTSFKQQFEELLPKLSQYIDKNGKELIDVINQALNIQKNLIHKIQQKYKTHELMKNIQKRFLFKLYLSNPQNDEEQQSETYFEEIIEKHKKIGNLPYFVYITDQLIEADFNTLQFVYNSIKDQSAFEYFNQQQNIIDDLELNNYLLNCLKNSEINIKDEKNQTEFLKQQNKEIYIQKLINLPIERDQNFNQFKDEFINQLKIKFWIFQNELTQNDDQLNHKIKQIFNKYSRAIFIKIPLTRQFQSLIKKIIDDEDKEGLIEYMLEQKINKIHKYVEDKLQKYNLSKLNTDLGNIYKGNKQIYLQKLKNNLIITQQVDIIMDYCARIRILIEQLRPSALVDFTDSDQQDYLIELLKFFFPNYNNLDQDVNFIQELSLITNKFCPLLSIGKSSSFKMYKKNFEEKQQQQQNLLKFIEKSQKKADFKLQFLNYERVNIYQCFDDIQDFNQLQNALYQNNKWDQFQKLLIKETKIQLEIQGKKLRKEKFNEEKNKIKQICAEKQIPFKLIETIYKYSYQEMKENENMEKIFSFFKQIIDEDYESLSELQKYVEIDKQEIDNRQKQINEYLEQQVEKAYQSIQEFEEEVTNLVTKCRQNQFKKQYIQKKLIQKIQQVFNNECESILQNPPTFNQFKLEISNQEQEIQDIDSKIVEFYENQLMDYLKKQFLQQ
ncbi:unnamed protein product [Paramecium sonneborni]|uniref:Uncharacterized protein n=1 Tax=Paramecium sonneborni TaxID=65129 RepID=A0A8S1MRA8_9CILI|nr:unnamed protein product [Paramecium sonneborni]